MILLDVDTKPTYEAMKRGEWPEPNPEVVAAHKALTIKVEGEAKPQGEESARKLADPEPESSRRLA